MKNQEKIKEIKSKTITLEMIKNIGIKDIKKLKQNIKKAKKILKELEQMKNQEELIKTYQSFINQAFYALNNWNNLIIDINETLKNLNNQLSKLQVLN